MLPPLLEITMKIIVCIKEVVDPALNIDFGLTNRVVFREGLPLKLNPNDAAALSLALDIKNAAKDAEIILISIGPERVESYLRDGLALGADKALRIRDEDCGELSPHRKARLLTGAVKLLGAGLVLTGARSLDTSNGQVGGLMAGWLDWPGVGEVLSLEPDAEHNGITLIKDIGRGEREKISCPLPAVIAVKGEGKLPYASLDSLIESKYAAITRLSPADLALTGMEFENDPARVADLVFPRPALRRVPPLDSSLPAFDRILQLLTGGIARRQGLVLRGGGEEMAERLFEILKEAGVLRSAAGP
jgi:electron transfer flavoprotein beta subunit